MSKRQLLFYIILVEGYTVLAAELLAIRGLVPFVGSGTEVVALVISAVLLPLAVGYHHGGQAYATAFRRARRRGQRRPTVRGLLLKNVLTALPVLALGLSYLFMEFFFGMLIRLGVLNPLLHTALYGLCFLVWPVFLLGQTLPLVSHYFSKEALSRVTGTMLFFSTTGSFLGSVFSTLVLMSTLGVHTTATLTLLLLASLVPLLARQRFGMEWVLAVLWLSMAWTLNHASVMERLHIVSNNAYNIVRVKETPGSVQLDINRSASSLLSADRTQMFPYIRYINRLFIDPLVHAYPARNILVIGSGGFTVGIDDPTNQYTFVDIDPALQSIAETHVLKAPLPPTKQFVASSARAFLKRNTTRYDLIVIDVYTNVVSIPMECTSQEFLAEVKRHLAPGGAVVANIVGSPTFADRFTIRYTNTFASVFPKFSRQLINDFNPWVDEKPSVYSRNQLINMLYIYTDRPGLEDATVYTDDQNTYSLDR